MNAPHCQRAPSGWGLRVRAGLWLLLLGVVFFSSYALTNHLSALRAPLPSIMFDWERGIPLLPWTIVPYWSIDLMYAAGVLLLPQDRRQLSSLVRRLLTVQALCVLSFLAYPLTFSLQRPPLEGVFGTLFDVLMSFDQPYNQAPSLHIALLVVLWHAYAQRLGSSACRWLLHGWCVLIGLSVLTTWQHHFIDVPTGALVGAISLWLWPSRGASPLQRARLSHDRTRRRLAARYAIGAGVIAALAGLLATGTLGGWSWWLGWPALSLSLVALNYLWLGVAGFQKDNDGRLSLAARLLLAPYLVGAWINSRLWTRRRPHPAEVCDGVSIGRLPLRQMPAADMALVDLCAELSAPAQRRAYTPVPVLDLTVASATELRQAAEAIEQHRRHGPVLVCCALGVSRSASAVAAWLLLSGRTASVDDAISIVRGARPICVLRAPHRQALNALVERGNETPYETPWPLNENEDKDGAALQEPITRR
ncbi:MULTISPECIES: phosphatase PAP2/dual specificity phosphatase family protein [unclassified Halomonas]|uniref:phosphatase PAP2/dual specificity phosphatase family protein n=1 Tax=unclassified Halomonas TaxID=2609666 RepID=UPI001C976F1A|nr:MULTISPECIES: phosphatase PAP2/dual specificity phosphatase family protein [unclassified Halomonas]MBY5926037.1 phosphatase PAP2/dual specificity phosphatase family protein [Halomonas sp. DP4Y7-2]MBY6233079.1 phosphatase PAP2/dual specificity phosphatase family protein [Halomonas sp. DP4Y7-1]